MERLKMHSLCRRKDRTGRYGRTNYPVTCSADQDRQWIFEKIRGYQSPWYRVCTKAMFISKQRYGYGEAKNAFTKNAFTLSVQITHWALRAYQLFPVSFSAVQGRQLKIAKIQGYQSPLYRVCTKAMFISKGSYGHGEAKNAFALSVQTTNQAIRACQRYTVSRSPV